MLNSNFSMGQFLGSQLFVSFIKVRMEMREKLPNRRTHN